jgi:UPF0271 protein
MLGEPGRWSRRAPQFRGALLFSMRIDLNADVGEACGDDAALMPWITSANIAAGAHAGSPSILRQTVRLARDHGVAIGEHFGRRELQLPPDELEALVLDQIAAVDGVARSEGVRLRHVKTHGALYNLAARDRAVADSVARAVTAFDRSLLVFAPPDSAMADAAEACGLRVVREAFADRVYEPDGRLAPRGQSDSVLTEVATVARRAVVMALDQRVVARDGTPLSIQADTICIHGDTPGAARLAEAVRTALRSAGVVVAAVGEAA